jgi:DNA-binding beta-propeller fold protein YncE
MFDWGKKGDGPGEFDVPHAIALDAQSRLFVADRANARVQVFDGNGKFLFQWKSDEMGRPWDVAFGPDGSVYVVDGGDMNPQPPERGRVLKLDSHGKIVDTIGRFGKYDGQFYWAHSVSVAGNGDVYVGDVNVGMRVQKFVRR